MIIKLINNRTKRPKEFDDLRKAESTITEKDNSLGKNYYIHKVPDLPKWTDKTYKCQQHKVNLFQLTCTCEEFINDRSVNFKKRDIRLCCKHLYYKISDKRFSKFIDSLTLNLAEGTGLKNERYYYKYIIYNETVIFGFIPGSDWIGVYAKTPSGNFFRYSYNPVINKWARRLIPDQEAYIIDQLQKAIYYQLPYSHKLSKIEQIINGG